MADEMAECIDYTHWAYFPASAPGLAYKCAAELSDLGFLPAVDALPDDVRSDSLLLRAARVVEVGHLPARHDLVEEIVLRHGGKYDGGGVEFEQEAPHKAQGTTAAERIVVVDNDDQERYVAMSRGREAARLNPQDVSPKRIAEDAIGLFLEYRDQHGHSEDDARIAAVYDVAEEVAVDLAAFDRDIAGRHKVLVGDHDQMPEIDAGGAFRSPRFGTAPEFLDAVQPVSTRPGAPDFVWDPNQRGEVALAWGMLEKLAADGINTRREAEALSVDERNTVLGVAGWGGTEDAQWSAALSRLDVEASMRDLRSRQNDTRSMGLEL